MAELKLEDGSKSSRKRGRDEFDDSGNNSPVSKLARIDSVSSENGDSGLSSPEAKRIQEDLLSFLDDADDVPTTQDLDLVIRSFEEEILVPEKVPSVAAESVPELGFLLEASDDELGLPPSFPAGEQKTEAVDLTTTESGAIDFCDMALGFENEMPFQPCCDFGIGGGDVNVSNDYVTLGGGLFESYEAGDISEFPWRSETLSAL